MLRRVLSTAKFSAISSIAARGAIFGGTLFIAKGLGPEIYGHFALVQTTALLFTTSCAQSFGQLATKTVTQSIGSPDRLIASLTAAYTSAVAVAALLMAALVIFSKHLTTYLGLADTESSALILATLVIPVGFIHSVQNGTLLALNRVKQQAKINLWVSPLSFGVLVACSLQGSLPWAVAGYIAAQSFVVLAQEIMLRASLPTRKTWRLSSFRKTRKEDWAEVWKLGLLSSLAGMASMFATWFSLALLAKWGEESEVGLFSLGNQARLILMFCVAVTANATLPILTRLHQDKTSQAEETVALRFGLLLGSASAVVALFIYLAAYVGIPLFLPDYGDALRPMIWLLASVAFTAPTAVLMRKAVAKTQPQLLISGNVLYAILLCAISVVLVKSGSGAEGVSIAYFVASILQFLGFAALDKAFNRRAASIN